MGNEPINILYNNFIFIPIKITKSWFKTNGNIVINILKCIIFNYYLKTNVHKKTKYNKKSVAKMLVSRHKKKKYIYI